MPESQKCGKMAPVETGSLDLRADLHLHTTASDGRWTPQQLLREVQRVGIGLFSVTDHDSLGSLAETAQKANTEAYEIVSARVKDSIAEIRTIAEKMKA